MTAGSYADVAGYRADTGDLATEDARIEPMLFQQSAKLRALCGISANRRLTEDQAAMARALVTDASRKALVPPSFIGMDEMSGARQASFSANGFQASATFSNPSGSAYFDGSMLKAFKRSLGSSQRVGFLMPRIGG